MSSLASGRRRVHAFSALLPHLQRLRDITGFASVCAGLAEPRTTVFARLWHVRRVVAVTRLLGSYWTEHRPGRVRGLAWLHDINRWPFAHNSERGRFDQPRHTPEFFSEALGVGPDDCVELALIQSKVLDGLSADGRLVLVADAVAGLVEDCLLLICGLNVRPDIVPRDVGRFLGFAHQRDPWRARSRRLAEIFHRGCGRQPVRAFQAEFRRLFLDQVDCFLRGQEERHGRLEPDRILAGVREVKRTFVAPVVFPINNELVCRGAWLKQRVLPWYLERDSEDKLLLMTETEFVDRVTSKPDSPYAKADFLPRLDAICHEQPERAFVTCPASRRRSA